MISVEEAEEKYPESLENKLKREVGSWESIIDEEIKNKGPVTITIRGVEGRLTAPAAELLCAAYKNGDWDMVVVMRKNTVPGFFDPGAITLTPRKK